MVLRTRSQGVETIVSSGGDRPYNYLSCYFVRKFDVAPDNAQLSFK